MGFGKLNLSPAVIKFGSTVAKPEKSNFSKPKDPKKVIAIPNKISKMKVTVDKPQSAIKIDTSTDDKLQRSERELDRIVPDVNNDYFPDIDSRYREGPKYIQMQNFKEPHPENVPNPKYKEGSAEPKLIPNPRVTQLKEEAAKKIQDANTLKGAIKPPHQKQPKARS